MPKGREEMAVLRDINDLFTTGSRTFNDDDFRQLDGVADQFAVTAGRQAHSHIIYEMIKPDK